MPSSEEENVRHDEGALQQAVDSQPPFSSPPVSLRSMGPADASDDMSVKMMEMI